jgi:hypothetical protein
MDDYTKILVPIFEFLGIPLIIITPIGIILFVLFKFIIPRILSKSSTTTALIVANVVAQLFGEGSNMVKGVDALDVVKLIKSLPLQNDDNLKFINTKLNLTCELITLMAEAIMSERIIKPQSSIKLQEILKKIKVVLATKPTANKISIDSTKLEDVTKEGNDV